MFLTVDTELLTMLMMSPDCDADALGSIKVEVEVKMPHSWKSHVAAQLFT